MSLKQKRL